MEQQNCWRRSSEIQLTIMFIENKKRILPLLPNIVLMRLFKMKISVKNCHGNLGDPHHDNREGVGYAYRSSHQSPLKRKTTQDQMQRRGMSKNTNREYGIPLNTNDEHSSPNKKTNGLL